MLVDSDAFCKLALADLLPDALALFDAALTECGRLPALPHMLEKGTLRRRYGESTADRLLSAARRLPTVPEPAAVWSDRLSPIPEVDPGEVILLSVAAEQGVPIITGDVRALRAVKDVEGFAEACSGRVAVLEAVLLGLCSRLGSAEVSRRAAPLRPFDTVAKVCFSPEGGDPEEGLRSYLNAREIELTPIELWKATLSEES